MFYCKNVLLILFNVLIPIIYGDDSIRCEPYHGNVSFILCTKNNELVHVKQTKHEDVLIIRGSNLESIAPNAFEDVSIRTFLLTLNVYKSEGSFRIQRESFEGLRQLQSLNIFGGVLQLEHHIFSALESLHTLSIIACRLTLAKNESFTGLSKLRKLTIITAKSFEMIPGIFTGLDELKCLELSSNNMTTIRKNIFHHMKHLDLLDLSYSEFSTIETGAFNGMFIKTLDLSGTKFTFIPIGAFNGASINRLELYRNSIVKIRPNAFGDSTNKKRRYSGRYIVEKLVGLVESTVISGYFN